MGELRLSRNERVRLELLGRVKRAEITVARAAELAGVSVRQMRRPWERYGAGGDAGVVHRSRGRAANDRLGDAERASVPAIYRARYADCGPTFACEKLAAEHGHDLGPNTLRGVLKDAGIREPRRRRAKHRPRRERRACVGQLVQMDGSERDGFEGRGGRGGRGGLMVMIDDATNRTLARSYPRENLDAAFDVFGRWAAAHGLPRALYVGRPAAYRADRAPTGGELSAGVEPATQFGRAMGELDVELILANSPQATGRAERRNRLLQDRLVKEMRLRGIGSIAAANAYLDGTYLAALNRDYTPDAADPADGHRAVPAGVRPDEVLCEQEWRAVGQDWCVRWRNGYLQVAAEHAGLGLAGGRVLVRCKRDGTVLLEHEGARLTWTPVPARTRPPVVKPTVKDNKPSKPAADHPWRRPAVAKGRPAG